MPRTTVTYRKDLRTSFVKYRWSKRCLPRELISSMAEITRLCDLFLSLICICSNEAFEKGVSEFFGQRVKIIHVLFVCLFELCFPKMYNVKQLKQNFNCRLFLKSAVRGRRTDWRTCLKSSAGIPFAGLKKPHALLILLTDSSKYEHGCLSLAVKQKPRWQTVNLRILSGIVCFHWSVHPDKYAEKRRCKKCSKAPFRWWWGRWNSAGLGRRSAARLWACSPRRLSWRVWWRLLCRWCWWLGAWARRRLCELRFTFQLLILTLEWPSKARIQARNSSVNGWLERRKNDVSWSRHCELQIFLPVYLPCSSRAIILGLRFRNVVCVSWEWKELFCFSALLVSYKENECEVRFPSI